MLGEKKRRPCLVHLCRNEGNHLFPKDLNRKAQWIQAIVHFKPLTIRKHSRICSAHFKPNDFIRTRLAMLQPNLAPKILKKTAIPSIFPWSDPQESSLTFEDYNWSIYYTTPKPEHQVSLDRNFSSIQKTYSRNKNFLKEADAPSCLPGITKSYTTETLHQKVKKASAEVSTTTLENLLEDSLNTNSQNQPHNKPKFSWQRADAVVDCDTDMKEKANWCRDDIYMYNNDRHISQDINENHSEKENDIDQEYTCDLCDETITGYRYTCVQCCDYDLCAACETKGTHTHHYMLRIPEPRPYSEVQCVLHTIRRVLLTDAVVPCDVGEYGWQVKVKEESPDGFEDVKQEVTDPISVEPVPEVDDTDDVDSLHWVPRHTTPIKMEVEEEPQEISEENHEDSWLLENQNTRPCKSSKTYAKKNQTKSATKSTELSVTREYQHSRSRKPGSSTEYTSSINDNSTSKSCAKSIPKIKEVVVTLKKADLNASKTVGNAKTTTNNSGSKLKPITLNVRRQDLFRLIKAPDGVSLNLETSGGSFKLTKPCVSNERRKSETVVSDIADIKPTLESINLKEHSVKTPVAYRIYEDLEESVYLKKYPAKMTEESIDQKKNTVKIEEEEACDSHVKEDRIIIDNSRIEWRKGRLQVVDAPNT